MIMCYCTWKGHRPLKTMKNDSYCRFIAYVRASALSGDIYYIPNLIGSINTERLAEIRMIQYVSGWLGC
jgi:hypothetical protein